MPSDTEGAHAGYVPLHRRVRGHQHDKPQHRASPVVDHRFQRDLIDLATKTVDSQVSNVVRSMDDANC